MLANAENTRPASHDRIRIAKVREHNYSQAQSAADELETYARNVDIPTMVRKMKQIVPEDESKNSLFEKYDRELEAEAKK